MYLLLTVLAVQQPAPPLASPVSDTAHVVIVATTDVHGRVLGWDYVRDAAAPGGLSRAATMVETLRAQYPEQVVLVDAGDLIEGNLFAAYFAERDSQRPHPVVDALNAMQYDAATPGNHEFDFGTAVLARATGDATRSEERRVGKEGRSLCDWSSDVCSSDLNTRSKSCWWTRAT